jgi:AAA+ ATPase superfamily predicted ATPase
MENIFIYGMATEGKWFTDREEDRKRLMANFTYGVNTIIISPRRYGKTSLVRNVINSHQISEIKIVLCDMFSCKTQEDFYKIFAKSIIKQTSTKWEEWVENARYFLSSLSPRISMGSDPMTDFTISFDVSDKQLLNEEILNLPLKIAKEKNIKIVVCIDEFQQIAELPDQLSFQKKLRSYWQLQANHVSYCLFGSKKHLMRDFFSKSNMPFYKFGDIMFLNKIPEKEWIPFIQKRFEDTGKQISEELAKKICRAIDNHSSYVQQLAWLVWVRTEKKATQDAFDAACVDLLNQNDSLFSNYFENLSALQINFLKAIADGHTENLNTMEVLQKYEIPSSSHITRMKKSLEQKEIIDITNKKITFSDPAFLLWFQKFISKAI